MVCVKGDNNQSLERGKVAAPKRYLEISEGVVMLIGLERVVRQIDETCWA